MINKLKLNQRLWLLLPYFVISILFIILPFIFLTWKAFAISEENFDNWEWIKQYSIWKIFFKSIYIGIFTSLITLIISLPFAYFVASIKNKFTKIFLMSLIISPLFIFTISKLFALRGLLITLFDYSVINNTEIIILGLVYLNLPFMIIPLYSVFSNMPKSLLDASHDLGFSFYKTFFKVIIPYSLKAILSSFALVFILSSTSIVVTDKLLIEGNKHKMIGNFINDSANLANKFDIAKTSSIVFITILIITFIYVLIYPLPICLRKIWKKYHG